MIDELLATEMSYAMTKVDCLSPQIELLLDDYSEVQKNEAGHLTMRLL